MKKARKRNIGGLYQNNTIDIKDDKGVLQLYTNKCDNLHEMDRFLKHYLPNVIEGEIEYASSLLTMKEIEFIVTKKSSHKIPGPYHFTVEF